MDRASGRHDVLLYQSVKDVTRIRPQGRNACIGKLDEDALRPFSEDVDFLDSGNVQQILTEGFRLPREQAKRKARSIYRDDCEDDVRILVIHNWRQVIMQLHDGFCALLLATMLVLLP